MITIEEGVLRSKLVGKLGQGLLGQLKQALSFADEDHIRQRNAAYRKMGYIPKHLKWDGITYLLNNDLTFPSGLIFDVCKILDAWKQPYEIVQMYEVPEPDPQELVKTLELRPYQRKAVETIKEFRRGIIRLAPGGGKTKLSLVACAEIGQFPFMFLVHRISLLEQTHKEYSEFLGEEIGWIGDGIVNVQKINIVSIATICSILKIKHDADDNEKLTYTPEQVAQVKALIDNCRFVIVDECFPSNVTVDGKPISQYQPNDIVTSFDETTNQFVKRKVVSVSKTPVMNLVYIQCGPDKVVCTPSHKFLTRRGWIPAIFLRQDDEILKDGVDSFIRVDSVTFLERTSAKQSINELCPDGHVYNLEVEGTHNYLANGLVAHNCHHGASSTYGTFLKQLHKAVYSVGLSGTPQRTDGKTILLTAAFGPIVFSRSSSWLIRKGFLCKPTIRVVEFGDRLSRKYPRKWPRGQRKPVYNTVYKHCVVENTTFNNMVATIAVAHALDGDLTLVSVKQVKHGEPILEAVKRLAPDIPAVFLHASNKKKLGEDKVKQDFGDGKIKILISTLFDEGVDIPKIDTVIDAGGGNSPIKTLQLIGRALRKYPGKEKATIYMFAQPFVFLFNQFVNKMELLSEEPEFDIEYLNWDA